MGGFFGVVSRSDCVTDLFYGTDYHSHLGTQRGGLAVCHEEQIDRYIHDITNTQFRSKFADDVNRLNGNKGIGVISDYEDQPLIIGSHLGPYAIVTVGAVSNLDELTEIAFKKRTTHFSEMSGGEVNPTELIATVINQEANFTDGLLRVQDVIKGSCSILLLTKDGIYAARDRWGRTPVMVGSKEGAKAISFETCAFFSLGYEIEKCLGPGEIVFVQEESVEQLAPPREEMRICTFLWVYYGYPASSYEDINVEDCRYRCGKALADSEDLELDTVAGIPDSGVAHALGYANAAEVPYTRPFVKYTPTWPRSFMPQKQATRDLVAKMKLIPVPDLIKDKKILFCEDSIVRGTQLKDTIQRIFEAGAVEVHMRSACPPLMYGCPYLNFSRSRSLMDLAARQIIEELEGDGDVDLEAYTDPDTEQYKNMVEGIRKRLGLTTLKYQRLEDLVEAVGLPREKLCTHCWNGQE